MDIDDLFKSVNKYARDYIQYLVRFFDHRDKNEQAEHIADTDGRIIVHSLISLTLGIYLTRVFVDATAPKNDDIMIAMANHVGYWLFFAIVILVLARILVRRATFLCALSATLRVFPPAFMIGSAAILFVCGAVYAFGDARVTPEAAKCRGWIGLLGGAVVIWGLTIYGLRFSLSQATAHSEPLVPAEMIWRRRLVVTFVALLLLPSELIIIGPRQLENGLQDNCRKPRVQDLM
jgi:hypothetical protein